MSKTWDVQVGVFGQNEATRIKACLTSISVAVGSRRALITLILNGSTDDGEQRARAIAPGLGPDLRIYRIPHADKSNSINRFFYDLREPADLYVCVDAYVTISPGAIDAIEARFAERPTALTVTGVAGNGRTEPKSNTKTIERGGVIHGQLYAMRPTFLRRVVDAGVRLPVSLYRGDGLIGSMTCHDLDPVTQPWIDQRLVGAAGAVFEIDALSLLRVKDLRRQFRRKVRQMRGLVENAAIRKIVNKAGYTALPDNADDMIRDFLVTNPVPQTSLPNRPFLELALRQHRAAIRPVPALLEPVRVA